MSSEHLSEEPQSARGTKSSRDTGSDSGGGSADRPTGTFDEEEVTSTRDHNPTEENIATTGTLPRETWNRPYHPMKAVKQAPKELRPAVRAREPAPTPEARYTR